MTPAQMTPPPRAKNLALALLAMTQFVVVIDASIVNIALPSIGRALHFSQDDLSWVVNAYTLTFGGFLLLGGRLADLMGRRQDVHGRPRRLLARLAGRRPRAVRAVADRRARGAGPGRGDRLAGRAVDHHDDVRRRRRAQPRARRVGRRRRRRRRRGRAARRRADERAQLALGAVRQRADRRALRVPRAAPAAREPRRGRDAQLRHTGRRDRHGRARAARLRARRRRQRRLGLDGNARSRSPARSCCWSRSWRSSCARARR